MELNGDPERIKMKEVTKIFEEMISKYKLIETCKTMGLRCSTNDKPKA